MFSPDNPIGILDADNYLYKPIIDAIAFAVYSLDGFEHFSYSCYNLADETLNAGTYLVISNSTQKVGFFDFFASLLPGLNWPK